MFTLVWYLELIDRTPIHNYNIITMNFPSITWFSLGNILGNFLEIIRNLRL